VPGRERRKDCGGAGGPASLIRQTMTYDRQQSRSEWAGRIVCVTDGMHGEQNILHEIL